MQVADLKKYVAKIVVLDLINGQNPTTRIDAVSDDGVVTCKQMINFIAQPRKVPDGNGGERIEMIMNPMPYGAPLYNLGKAPIKIDAAHIIMVFNCPDKMDEAYATMTGTIIPANSSILTS